MRYRTFMIVPSRTIDHGNALLSISSSKPRFTEKQGQYLAFIHTYVLLNRRPPSEADMRTTSESRPHPSIAYLAVCDASGRPLVPSEIIGPSSDTSTTPTAAGTCH